MNKLAFSAKSLDDLRDILAYVAKDKPAAAVKLIDRIKDRCNFIVNFPQSGSSRDDLIPGLRCLSIGNYVIYFRSLNDAIRIERVLHAARDVDALFRS